MEKDKPCQCKANESTRNQSSKQFIEQRNLCMTRAYLRKMGYNSLCTKLDMNTIQIHKDKLINI